MRLFFFILLSQISLIPIHFWIATGRNECHDGLQRSLAELKSFCEMAEVADA
jgi:hypothetical protein